MLRHLAFLCQNIIHIIMKLREGKKTSMHWGTECKCNYFPLTDLLEGTHS